MFKDYPLVSIATPSYNQGRYIEETIQSVLKQDYPRIEHIVVDGGSTDETLSILRRYSHLKWVSEPDRGQSHAINKGFQMAKGEIVAWLNSDDTYLPGAVTAAVEALDKSKGRYIVMGECPFIDKEGNPTGVYHPSTYRTRRDLIKIWKGLYSIPQPTVFFFKELLDEFGGLDESLYFAMDYELWLRFSKKCRFTLIKKPLATYRLHERSKTMETSEQELLKKTVEISRRYWGPKSSPSYWYYHLSFRFSQIFLWKISNVYWNRSVDCYNRKKWARAVFCLFIALSLYPPAIFRKKHVFSHLVKTYISKAIGSHLDRLVLHPDPAKCDGKVYDDGWVSDYAVLPLDITPSARKIEIVGEAHLIFFDGKSLSIRIFLNDSFVEERVLAQSGEFRIPIDLEKHPRANQHEIRLYPDKIFIPRVLGEGPDKRRLSFICKGIALLGDGERTWNASPATQKRQSMQRVSDGAQPDSMNHTDEYIQRLKGDHHFFASELSGNAETLVKNYLRYYKIVPENYIRRYLSHIKQDHIHNPLATLYIESELGAPMRMLELVRILRDQGYDVNGKSILDVGCSNGALLLACHEYGAANLVGIDVDERRLDSARLLIGEKNITLLNMDILSADLPPQYRTLDIIFATDVLEHVRNPYLFFTRIKELLSSAGGSFGFFSLFNRYSFQNIKSEPHYNVPGMILLEHDAARELWYEVRDAMHSTLGYEVGHWYSFAEYATMAAGVGLELTFFGKDTFKMPPPDYKRTIAEFGQEVRQLIEALPASEGSKQRLHVVLEAYCRMYEDDHRRYITGTFDTSVLYNKYYRQPVYMRCGHKRATPNG